MDSVAIQTVTGVDANNDPAEAQFLINYDDTLAARQLVGVNNTNAPVECRIVGLDGDGNEDVANKTYSLIVQPAGPTGAGADAVTIPANGAGAIQLAVNSRGKIGGFNTYAG